jgi:alpha-glucosidase
MNSVYANYLGSIHHDGSNRYVYPVGDPEPNIGGEVILRIRTAPDAPIERVLLRTAPDGEGRFEEMWAQDLESGEGCKWWSGTLQLSMPVVHYRFLLLTEDGNWWYNGSGLHRYTPTDAQDFRILAGYEAPTWVQDSVFYQIFPDRFVDGESGNNVREGEWVYRGEPARSRQWGETPTKGSWAALVEFYGGDLQGIESQLDYIEDLGVNALYLNPIFTAFSNHRYDVTDYENVDPHLGGNQALINLRKSSADRGLKFIIDIVPNHCGVLHPWFQSAKEDPNSPTADFFTFQQRPDDYEAWLGVRSLPKLNYRSVSLREVMYAGEDSIFRRWLREPYAVDGWRIDVANMLACQGSNQLGVDVGRGIREAVKSEKPEAYLLGENFFDSSSQLQGDMWDATMYYAGFQIPLKHWLSQFEVYVHKPSERIASQQPWSTRALVDTWEAHRASIPWIIARQQFNLLGSHDTPRFRAIVNNNPALNQLAVTLLMTYPGIPSVYYGDEVGLGEDINDSQRECMQWNQEKWDGDLRSFYQHLIRLRRSSKALIEGGFQILMVERDTLAYLRDSDVEKIIVVAHRGPGTRPASPMLVSHGAIPDGMGFVELFTGRSAGVVDGHLPLGNLLPGVEIWQGFLR